MHRLPFAALLAAALVGCGGEHAPPASKHLPASVATPPNDAALLRVLHAGGGAELLRAQTLTPREWIFQGGLPSLSRILGASAEEQTVYATDATGHLVAIDVMDRRWHPVPTSVRQFDLSPDGSILGVDSARRAVRVTGRGVVTYRAGVERGAVILRGPGDDIITVGGHPNTLTVLGATGEVRRLPVPAGRVAATWIGDLAAIATDTAVVVVDVTGRVERGRKATAVHSIRMRGEPTVATFSPSGHRIYVATRKAGLAMVDRFTRRLLRELPLPGAADRLRVDRSGRWLMAESAEDSTLWVVDLSRWAVTTTRRTPWEEDLPQVIDGRTLLARDQSNLVAVNLDGDTSRNQGVLVGGAGDLYYMLPWIPERIPGTQIATADRATDSGASREAPVAAATPPAPPPPAAAPAHAPATLYLQVSSSQNQDWAKAFSQQLKDGGFPSRVLDPSPSDASYRVVVGPYTTRAEADSVGKRLGRSYFIVTSDSGGT